ncbi:MAG: F0F1 ATP synthase subunit C [Candidatus Heimdallarchaeota archaeon]|nr:F0F1 ATP synthase subunit C [Candidatus Heimdallarchaeota archaeon]MCK4769893.1 F0F1 ATP synthase subunit C [Candidatus Heimdallarchaeota archaeon]
MFSKTKTNRIFILIAILIAVIVLASNSVFAAEPGDLTPIAAALAVGIAGAAAAIGMGMAGSAAVGAITEKPEIFGKAFLFIVLIEAVAIYGLLVAILLVF